MDQKAQLPHLDRAQGLVFDAQIVLTDLQKEAEEADAWCLYLGGEVQMCNLVLAVQSLLDQAVGDLGDEAERLEADGDQPAAQPACVDHDGEEAPADVDCTDEAGRSPFRRAFRSACEARRLLDEARSEVDAARVPSGGVVASALDLLVAADALLDRVAEGLERVIEEEEEA